jgi:transcriptional regulator with XRE-family HTH domain
MPNAPDPQQQRWLRDFGNSLRAAREAAGLTQETLGLKAGLHVTYVSDVERGKRNLSLISIRRLASALNVSPGSLFGEN